MTRRWRNWARNQQCQPVGWHTPTTEADVQALIQDVGGSGSKLRVVGAGHSWSDIVPTDGHLVSLDALCAVHEIDTTNGLVRVGGGARLKDLNDALAEAGLAFENLGSIAEQSIAGAISTGTHGSSRRYGNLATQIVSLRLVDGLGGVHALSRAGQPDVFRAAVLSLGALGVITEVTIRCRPAFDLHERTFQVPFDEAVDQLDALSQSAEFVKLWWLPHTDIVQVFAADTITGTARKGPGAFARWMDHRVMPHVFTGVLGFGRMAPSAMVGLNRIVANAYFKTTERIDRSDRILNIPMPPRHREAEYAIPVEQAGNALAELRACIETENLRVNFPQELRFVAADDLPLSPDQGRATCRVGVYSGASKYCDRFFELAQERLLQRGGRPHWGKEFSVEPSVLQAMYPQLGEVARMRHEFDPNEVFKNPFVARLFDQNA